MHVQGIRFKRITDLILSRDIRFRQSSIPLNSDKEKSDFFLYKFRKFTFPGGFYELNSISLYSKNVFIDLTSLTNRPMII